MQISKITLCPLLVCLFSLATPAQQLLDNGDLEGGTYAPWNHPLYGASVVKTTLESGQGMKNSTCLAIESMNPRGYREWYQTVERKIPHGKNVTFSVMVRTQGLSGNAWIEIRARKSTRILAGATTRITTRVRGDQKWTRLTTTLKVPTETTTVQVACVIQGRGKAFFDDCILCPGSTLPKAGATTEDPKKTTIPTKVSQGEDGSTAIFVTRISMEVMGLKDEKNGKLIVALPPVTSTQIPYYFKVNAFPADAVRTMTLLFKGGRSTPPYLSLGLMPLGQGKKIKINLEGKLLVLPQPDSAPIPAALPKKFRTPSKAKPFLSLSNLTRSVEADALVILKDDKEEHPLPARLHQLICRAAAKKKPACTLVYALRTKGIPARLVTGIIPLGTPTLPTLAAEAWLPGPGWVRIIPTTAVLAPPAEKFLVLRQLSKESERRFSRYRKNLPEFSYIEPLGGIRIKGLRDAKNKLALESSMALALTTPDERVLKKLRKAIVENWKSWLGAVKKGKGNPQALFAGRTASQTKDFGEMLRILKKN